MDDVCGSTLTALERETRHIVHIIYIYIHIVYTYILFVLVHRNDSEVHMFIVHIHGQSISHCPLQDGRGVLTRSEVVGRPVAAMLAPLGALKSFEGELPRNDGAKVWSVDIDSVCAFGDFGERLATLGTSSCEGSWCCLLRALRLRSLA